MRALLSTSLALVLALAVVPAAQAQARRCDDRAGATIAATSLVRVYRDVSQRGDPVLRACMHGSRATVRLGVDGDCQDAGSIGSVVAAGRFVALTRVTCDTVSGDATVLLFDVKALRNVMVAAAFTGDTSGSGVRSVSVSELDVGSTGALAWVSQLSAGGVARAELHLLRPSTQAPDIVDGSDAFDLSEIAVTAHQLYWMHGGTAHELGF